MRCPSTHAPRAGPAMDVAAKAVVALGLRMSVGCGRAPCAFPLTGYGLRGQKRLTGHQGLVGLAWRPDPVRDGIDLAAGALGGPPIPHHVAGVLRILEHIVHCRFRPVPDSTGRVDRFRHRVFLRIRVQPFGDSRIAQFIAGSPGEYLAYYSPFHGVGQESGLRLPFSAPGRHRVGNVLRHVSVRRLSDVESILGVHFQTAARLLQHLQHVPLGDALLHPTGEGLGGAAPGRVIGSSEASSGTLAFSSVCSIWVPR